MIQFVGLDFETSGLSAEHHAPIQVGMVTAAGTRTESLIGGWTWARPGITFPGDFEWDERAEQIHGIKQEDLNLAPTSFVVDGLLVDWLAAVYPGARPAHIIPVGWNVASFDFAFLRRFLPRTARAMSYRSVDLNAIVFGMTQAKLLDEHGDPWGYDRLKETVKARAAHRVWEETGQEEVWHNACYDAHTAIYAFEELQAEMKGPV